MNLADYLEMWLETYYTEPKRAKNTVKAYRYALAHLSPEISGTELSGLQPIMLQKEINCLATTYSRQAQLLTVALRAVLRRAVKLGMIEKNPMEVVEMPIHEKAEICVLEPEEAAAYLRAATEEKAGPLLVLMLCIGLRRNEARGLRFGDLDEDGILHIRHQRTRQGLTRLKSKASRRDVPVPEALRAFFDGPDGDFLCNLSETQLRRQHLRVLAAIGVDRRVTLHGLRHTCATMAVMDGIQMATVQHLLGHAHFQVTADTYIHPDLRHLAQCTNVVFGSFCHHTHGARLEIV